MLVDVDTIHGTSLAKVIQENKNTYTISYLSYKKKGIYDYESPCEVEKECISGFYNPEDTETAAGFKKVEGGFILVEDSEDEDYEPSETESESESDISLLDEEGSGSDTDTE